MTFSIAGRCARTGMFGVAITTSSICVGARCPHARSGVGAVSTQNVTDPDLARLVLNEMEAGHSARDAIERVTEDRTNINYRQLIAVDSNGSVGSWTGTHILGHNGVSEGEDCIAAGNLLKTAAVPIAMTDAFAANAIAIWPSVCCARSKPASPRAARRDPSIRRHFSSIIEQRFALVDLRCDWSDDDPVKVLRKLWIDYEPQMEAYLIRALDPCPRPELRRQGRSVI